MKEHKKLISDEEKFYTETDNLRKLKVEVNNARKIEEIPIKEQIELIEVYGGLSNPRDLKKSYANFLVGSYGLNVKRKINGYLKCDGYQIDLLQMVESGLKSKVRTDPNNAQLTVILEVVEDILKNNDSTFSDEVKDKSIEGLKLKVSQIALIYAYNEIPILPGEDSIKIAELYHNKSGAHLYNKFIFYFNRANRRGKPHPFTDKKLSNKIQLLESVIDLVNPDKREKVRDEIKMLKSYDVNE